MCTKRPIAILALVFLLSLLAEGQAMFLDLGQEEIVQAGGIDIQVDAYSAPCHGDWNGDDLPDLLVGDGGIIYAGTIHLYLNVGVLGNPSFSDAGHIQAGEADLEVPGTACMGAFPRIVFWNEDLLPDLLVGDAYGQVWIFLNEGEDGSPLLGAGSLVQVGPPGGKVPISVYGRATPVFEDWDEDGKRDLVVGAIDGRLHLFLNEGSDTDPDFLAVSYGQATGGDLYVSGGRASPVLLDIDGDGRKDLLSGNTLGEILVYLNIGSDASPMFDTYINLESGGLPIDFEGTPRTRPQVCDWTGDGYLDLLTGLGDGRVHLFQANPTAAPDVQAGVSLHQPWPNPANPFVNIGFTLKESGSIRLSVFDIKGRCLSTLASGYHEAGRYDLVWKGRRSDGKELPSGIYLVSLKAQEFTESQRVILLR